MRPKKAAATSLITLSVILIFGALPATPASAQTLYLFLTTGPLPALLLLLNDNKQILHFQAGSEAFIQCEHFGGHGTITTTAGVMWASTGKINGKYSKCKFQPVGNVVNIPEVEYEINAQGSLRLLRDISLNIPAVGCTLTLKAATNQHLLLLLFLKDPLAPTLALLIHAEISGIHASASSEVACGTTGLLPTTLTYEGLLLAWVDGGTIQWMG